MKTQEEFRSMNQTTADITSEAFLSAVKNRRTIYALGKESPVSDDRIKELVGQAVMHTPSAFNSQSARVLVLFGAQHDKLWDITMESLRKIVPADQFSSTEQRINSFKSGYGSILYYECQDVIRDLQKRFETYKDNFPVWSQQSSGMLQYVIWTALELEGLGASLQHYNELIEEEVRKAWNVSSRWKLIAQMPFGKVMAPPQDKEFKPLEDRMQVYN
jgi:uncharacterized protein